MYSNTFYFRLCYVTPTFELLQLVQPRRWSATADVLRVHVDVFLRYGDIVSTASNEPHTLPICKMRIFPDVTK